MADGRKLKRNEGSIPLKTAVKYCIEHDILKQFLEKHASEVENMLLTEWNMDDAIEVAREEAWEDGCEERERAIARNALAEGATPEFIQKITGLDMETILNLNKK